MQLDFANQQTELIDHETSITTQEASLDLK
jgi:hypothetical protein